MHAYAHALSDPIHPYCAVKFKNITLLYSYWTAVNISNSPIVVDTINREHVVRAHTYVHSFFNSVLESKRDEEIMKQEQVGGTYKIF
jgi:hypothetical protein